MNTNYNNINKQDNRINVIIIKDDNKINKPVHRDFFSMSRFVYPVYKAAIAYAGLDQYVRIRRDRATDELILSCSEDCPSMDAFFKFVEKTCPRYYECVYDLMTADIKEIFPIMKQLTEEQSIQLLRFRDQARKRFYISDDNRNLSITLRVMASEMDVVVFTKLYGFVVNKYSII